ncbi:endonuclease/exonuclease/phosphatase family protein [Myroides sp. M-43]|nr:endonuclease/exonuclease/phosphatase family protein [Myroides oncorhynchi]
MNSLAAIVNSKSVDIVTLQELDVNNRRSGITLNQIAELALRTGMYYEFGKTIEFAAGAYGIGILSKFPIVESAFYPLPYIVETEEKRGLLVCSLDLGNGKRLTVATTHLASQSNESRVLQAKEVVQIGKSIKIDVLTGDFNAIESETPIAILKEAFVFDSRFTKQWTIPTERSIKKIDFIVKSILSRIMIQRQAVYPLDSLSDHNMMLSDFTLE